MLESLYIDYSYWNELSSQTRSPLVAAQNILSGKEVFGVSNQNFLKFINHKKIINFENLILIKENRDFGKTVILEGHSRLTIYALNPKIRPKELRVLLGYSQKITRWGYF